MTEFLPTYGGCPLKDMAFLQQKSRFISHEKWSFWRFSNFCQNFGFSNFFQNFGIFALKSAVFKIFEICKRLKVSTVDGEQMLFYRKNLLLEVKFGDIWLQSRKILKSDFYDMVSFYWPYLPQKWPFLVWTHVTCVDNGLRKILSGGSPM